MASNTLHPNEYLCPHCSAHFATKQEQARHLSFFHNYLTPWICHECPLSYPNLESFGIHWDDDHDTLFHYGGYTCFEGGCGLLLASKDMAARHLRHDHVEQHGREKRQCTILGCSYENDCYIGMSLHFLHVHPTISTDQPPIENLLHQADGRVDHHRLFGGPNINDSGSSAQTSVQKDNKRRDSIQEGSDGEGDIEKGNTRQSRTQVAEAIPLPPLPNSILEYGYEAKDFDPRRVYELTVAERSNFKPFPPDLADEHIFNADPSQISYDNLLRIAPNYSTLTIYKKVHEGRPGPVFKSLAVVAERINSALVWKAERENPVGGVETLRRSLEDQRAKNGIMTGPYRRKKVVRATKSSKNAHATNSSTERMDECCR